MRSFRVIASFALLLMLPSSAIAHTILVYPTPRFDRDDVKEPSAPCGGPRGDTVTEFTPGETVTLEWRETIDHPGYFFVQFSEVDDDNWQVLLDNIPHVAADDYSEAVTLPDIPCDACTLRLVQVMEETNPPTNYYSCADIAIVDDTTGDDVGTSMDMGNTEPDTGQMAADMGSSTEPDFGHGNNGTSAGDVGLNPGPGGQTKTDGSEEPTKITGKGTCSAVAGGPAGLLPLLGFLLFIGRIRRD